MNIVNPSRPQQYRALNLYFNRGVIEGALQEKYRLQSQTTFGKILGRLLSAALFFLIMFNFFGRSLYSFYESKYHQLKDYLESDDTDTKSTYADQSNTEEETMTKKPRKKKTSKHQITNMNVKFSDVVGIGDERAELEEVVKFLQDPDPYVEKGARLPKGILLSGKPGVGKTLVAKAVAGEAGAPFFFIDASGIDGPFVGSGTKKLKQIFEDAKKVSPSIIFIDEIDSIGGKRSVSGKYPYARHTINMLLSLMDGFDQEHRVVVIGSTNLPEVLDEALTRSGRFDMTVNIPPPQIKQRYDILQHYLSKILTTVDIDVDELSRITGGMVPADLKNLVDTAGRIAVNKANPAVTQTELIEAIDQISMGLGLKSKVKKVSKETYENTAWHEAGHAVSNYLIGKQDLRFKAKMNEHCPVHKITIIPRGKSGGHTAFLQDDGFWYEEDIVKRLIVAYGGYVGEEMYGEYITTGPSGDFQAATNLAKELVLRNLMGKTEDLKFNSIKEYEKMSDTEKQRVDKEIIKVTTKAYKDCKNMLEANRHSMKVVAEALVEYHQISAEEMELIIKTGHAHAGKHLRIEEDTDLNHKRIIKPKNTAPKDVPEDVILQNLKNLGQKPEKS